MSLFMRYLLTNLRCQYYGISIGQKSRIHLSASVRPRGGGKIFIGDRCSIHSDVKIWSYGGIIEIGNDCSINPFSVIYGHGGLEIGNGVRIAAHTVIIPANHSFDRRDIPIFQQSVSRKGIVIEDDVWIGAGVRILDNVRISTGCVIAAGCVVTKSTEPFSIYAGVPGKKIGNR